MTLDEFFSSKELSRCIFDALNSAVSNLGASELRVTKSQVAFRRRKTFAWAWIPGMYLRGEQAPLVLTSSLRQKVPSKRWKQVVDPAKGRFTHHLELRTTEENDREVCAWLLEAGSEAG